MSKPPAFQPAPRPRPRTSSDEARQLADAAGDLGFTRASTAPEAQDPKSPLAPTKSATLKFEVPEALWIALRQEALNRRVTVKYLVLEALAARGYAIDLTTIPEDGRRNR